MPVHARRSGPRQLFYRLRPALPLFRLLSPISLLRLFIPQRRTICPPAAARLLQSALAPLPVQTHPTGPPAPHQAESLSHHPSSTIPPPERLAPFLFTCKQVAPPPPKVGRRLLHMAKKFLHPNFAPKRLAPWPSFQSWTTPSATGIISAGSSHFVFYFRRCRNG